MASPLSLLLFGVIAAVLAENEDSNSHPFNKGAVLPDAIKKPLSPYLNGINIETNFHEELAELNKINPVLSGVMEELHENIIAMESVLKAKYLFFTEIIEIFKKKKDNIGSDDPASILGQALHSVPEERREILADFLNFSEHLGYGKALQMSVHANVSAGTKTSSVGMDTPRNDSDVKLRKSLKTIETILTAVNNSLPDRLKKNSSWVLLVQLVRMTKTNYKSLTFEDIKNIFLALRNASFAFYKDVSLRFLENEVDFAATALYDILQKLCDIAIKLNPDRGESLKPYFNYYLGANMRYNTSITHYFSRVGKVASAAEFC